MLERRHDGLPLDIGNDRHFAAPDMLMQDRPTDSWWQPAIGGAIVVGSTDDATRQEASLATQRFDAIIIGAGQAGPALSARLTRTGMSVALVERKDFGGTCVNRGCIPTKTLVASARVAHMVNRAAEFGIRLRGRPRIDMAAVKARKDTIVEQFHSGVEGWLRATKGLTLFEAHGRFEGPKRVQAGDALLEAERIFINVGSRAAFPTIPGIEGVPWLNSTRLLQLDTLPEHLIVIGGGYIGLEFAQIYRRLGADVTVLERGDRLLPREDEDVSEGVRAVIKDSGVDVLEGFHTDSVARSGRRVEARGLWKGDARVIRGSHLLVAAGRVPNTADLGIENTGITLDERGFIPVDDQLRTSVPGIWALGDCNARGAFTHTSYNDYEILADNLLGQGTRRISDRIPASALFIDPPFARIGMTEREARSRAEEQGVELLVARMPMSRVGRARERSETQGFMKALVDGATRRILGASMLGINCDEVIQLLLVVMYSGQPHTLINRSMLIHPTVAELVPTLFERLKPVEQRIPGPSHMGA